MFSPAAIVAMLKGFGIDVDAILAQAKKIVDSGAADKVIAAVETLERVEKKLDELLALHQQERNANNGESAS